jgi:hypothetical protein
MDALKNIMRRKCCRIKRTFIREYSVQSNITLTERLRKINGFDIRARRLQDWDTWIRLVQKFGGLKDYLLLVI